MLLFFLFFFLSFVGRAVALVLKGNNYEFILSIMVILIDVLSNGRAIKLHTVLIQVRLK
jgi:hypothetical protein